ncbi:hypothetical protein, partial [Treponema sp. R6D11]
MEIGEIGEMSEDMEAEFDLFYIVMKGQSLKEVETWDLDDLKKMVAMYQMQQDTENAYQSYIM